MRRAGLNGRQPVGLAPAPASQPASQPASRPHRRNSSQPALSEMAVGLQRCRLAAASFSSFSSPIIVCLQLQGRGGLQTGQNEGPVAAALGGAGAALWAALAAPPAHARAGSPARLSRRCMGVLPQPRRTCAVEFLMTLVSAVMAATATAMSLDRASAS